MILETEVVPGKIPSICLPWCLAVLCAVHVEDTDIVEGSSAQSDKRCIGTDLEMKKAATMMTKPSAWPAPE